MGASGYVGSHLVPALRAAGWNVRAASRRAEALAAQAWSGVELVSADALQPETLDAALQGVKVAYYLVHSMAAGGDFPRLDRLAAAHFREAAARAGVQRIVYLGGLLPRGPSSAHLASRGETGDVLRQGPVPVTELRAGIIIGPGSAAFEVIRDLVFHLPVMVTPRWVDTRSQPIALGDVVAYLLEMAERPDAGGLILECGGPEVVTYRQLMQRFAALVDRRPLIVSVPVLTPRLSSYWLDLVTAVPANVARALIDGLGHEVVVHDDALLRLVPRQPLGLDDALRDALEQERRSTTSHARWSEGSMAYRRRPDFAFYAKRMQAKAEAPLPAARLWAEVASIGGDNGYYYLNTLWQLRGQLDRLVGGSGLTRGRRHPTDLAAGDMIDFWRVVSIEPGHRLTLLAEMRLPGAAALEFVVDALGEHRSRITVTAYFHPAGAPGLAYWHALAPAHAFIFPGLARAIVRRAAGRASASA